MIIMNDANGLKGLIIKGIAGFYYVKSGAAVYRCKARGIFKQRDIKPTVGDRVIMEVIEDNDDSWITEILPRENSFIRPFISNVDCFVIVTAVARPAPVLSVIDKFLVMAEKNRTDAILCINKCDLAENPDSSRGKKSADNLDLLKKIYEPIYPVVCTDSRSGQGIDKLKELMGGKTVALAGPSGVGKSTVLNRLIPEASCETGNISEKSQKGKHTTRHSELFEMGDGKGTMIFDTPGFTSFDIMEAEEDELQHLYPEIAKYLGQCKYQNCKHISEPECGVLAALEEGKIDSHRYESYKTQIEEIRKLQKY